MIAVLLALWMQDTPVVPRLELPRGPLAGVVATMAAEVSPKAALAPEGRLLSVSSTVDTPATWSAWAADLTNAQQTNAVEPRARLALVALEQERYDDAWSHLSAVRADEASLAALLPRFLPGVPAGSLAGQGGHAGALPDGVELHPALPYEPDREGATGWVPRAAKVDGLAIGKARVGLEITVEGEGIQVTLRHQGGEAATVKVRIPRHPEYAIEAEFVDWWQQDQLGNAWELELTPSGEEHVLYGRFRGGLATRAKLVPRHVPLQLQQYGAVVLIERDCTQLEALGAFARAIQQCSGVATVIAHERPTWNSNASSGLLIDWSDPQQRRTEWPLLAGRIERFVLQPR
jgi:hypothetical protein